MEPVVPREVRRAAFHRIPETCDLVSDALDAMMKSVAETYKIPLEDMPAFDAACRQAFFDIRDNATSRFRSEQMLLLNEIRNLSEYTFKRLAHDREE